MRHLVVVLCRFEIAEHILSTYGISRVDRDAFCKQLMLNHGMNQHQTISGLALKIVIEGEMTDGMIIQELQALIDVFCKNVTLGTVAIIVEKYIYCHIHSTFVI